jgi:autotransporter passenger strand-loop-strand repeat protein
MAEYIISSGESSNGIILTNEFMTILDDGSANNTTVNTDGRLSVSSGGTANSTTVNAGGFLYVSSGGTATNVVWTPCEGHVYLVDGGYATFASLLAGQ